MTDLTIKLLKSLDGDSTFASGEVFGKSGELVKEFDVPIGYAAMPAKLDLPPGPYLLRARLPSGQTVSAQITVKPGEVNEVVLNAFGTEHEWLSWHHFASGEAARGRRRIEDKSFLGASSGVRFEATVAGNPMPEVSLIAAVGDGSFQRYAFKPYDTQHIVTDDGTQIEAATYQDEDYTRIKVRAATSTQAPNWRRAYVHARLGDDLQQITVLPMPWLPLEPKYPQVGSWMEVLISRPSAVRGRSSGYAPPSIITSTLARDPVFGSLINFFGAGDLRTATRLTSEIEEQAKYFLYMKLTNPFAAAAGGYVLLAGQADPANDKWGDWTENLSNWVGWLPDGPIIRGWLLLRRDDQDGARSCFVTAASRGIPIYTAGLKLLLRGLIAVGADKDEGELAKALQSVRPFAAAVDPTNPFCTFYGSDPTSPTPPLAPKF